MLTREIDRGINRPYICTVFTVGFHYQEFMQIWPRRPLPTYYRTPLSSNTTTKQHNEADFPWQVWTDLYAIMLGWYANLIDPIFIPDLLPHLQRDGALYWFALKRDDILIYGIKSWAVSDFYEGSKTCVCLPANANLDRSFCRLGIRSFRGDVFATPAWRIISAMCNLNCHV